MKAYCFVLIMLIVLAKEGKAQFPPSAGLSGSTAIHADSNIFVNWAKRCSVIRGYKDIANPDYGYVSYGNENDAINKADNVVVSLGDAGIAILYFDPPICDKTGFDFAVFENAFNDSFLELAFVEISSDSIHWYRFPAISLTPVTTQTGTFGTTDPTLIHNLAGKYRVFYGTPFDISDITDAPNLDKNNIHWIKIIDVVGSIDPTIGSYDSQGNLINDPYPTPFETGGFDLDAIGVINQCENDIFAVNENDMISIYPNPACDILQVNSTSNEMLSIKIFNQFGTVHYNKHIYSNEIINIKSLASGIYYINISYKGTTINKKFIKN